MATVDECSRTATRPLTIAHVVRSTSFAGVEKYVIDVGMSLVARGHRVIVVGNEKYLADGARGSGIEVRATQTVLGAASSIVQMRRSADVLHLHMTDAEIAATMSWPLSRVPALATRHFAQKRGSSVAVRRAGSVIRSRLCHQVSISEFVASRIGEPSMVIPNGVPTAPAVDATARVVLVAQRLENEKRTADALHAWNASALDGSGWQMWIAGAGAQRDELEALARSLGLRAVQFLGHRTDLVELRKDVGMVLATAPAEPFGLSVVEAMAAGLPVVAADGGAHRETVGACEPSLAYEPGNVESCAQVLRRLADDVALRQKLGRRLREFQQERFGLELHVDRLEALYAEVVA